MSEKGGHGLRRAADGQPGRAGRPPLDVQREFVGAVGPRLPGAADVPQAAPPPAPQRGRQTEGRAIQPVDRRAQLIHRPRRQVVVIEDEVQAIAARWHCRNEGRGHARFVDTRRKRDVPEARLVLHPQGGHLGRISMPGILDAQPGRQHQSAGQHRRTQGVDEAPHWHAGVAIVHQTIPVRILHLAAIDRLAAHTRRRGRRDAHQPPICIVGRPAAHRAQDRGAGLEPCPLPAARLRDEGQDGPARKRHRVVADVRIAEHDQSIVELKLVRVADLGEGQIERGTVHDPAVDLARDPQHGQVQAQVVMHHVRKVGWDRRLVDADRDRDSDVLQLAAITVHHIVGVGQDQPIGADQRSGADARRRPAARRIMHAGEEHRRAQQVVEIDVDLLGDGHRAAQRREHQGHDQQDAERQSGSSKIPASPETGPAARSRHQNDLPPLETLRQSPARV